MSRHFPVSTVGGMWKTALYVQQPYYAHWHATLRNARISAIRLRPVHPQSSIRTFAKAMTESQSRYRLPQNVKPLHYDLAIKTDLRALTFEGIARIKLQVNQPTTEIVFNSFDLKIGHVSIIPDSTTADSDSGLKADSIEISSETERATAKFSAVLPTTSNASLSIRFGGKLTGSMLGYYFSKFKDNETTNFYTLTQFEPTAARRAFPCWDEPLLKATYSITMVSRKGTVNLSNMPVLSENPYNVGNVEHTGIRDLFNIDLASPAGGGSDTTDTGQWKVTVFDKTPPVSTYLVAFANGPFEHLESFYTSPISGKVRPLRVYATRDLIGQAQWGLDVKAKVLPVYEKVFDVEFPLPKLDTLVAHDFDSGAMENWGLITGRTSVYLLDPQNENFAAKKRIAAVQTHEVAHQWFGNIVTMAWWDNLWLNEGFATLMGEMVVLNKVQPDWNLYEEFVNEHLADALALDAKRSSHPIQVPIDNPDEINQIFDSLTYAKAGSVLRMLSEYVGEENFLKGVSIYLKKRLYGNSVETDLWAGIQEATGLDIPSLMNNWILKIGYPLLVVKDAPAGIVVRQDRFLETGAPKPEENETIWQVPLFLTTQDSSGAVSVDRKKIMSEREMAIDLDKSKLFLLKGGNRGVYRVQYTPELLKRITDEAAKKNPMIALEDRMGLINDTMALARANLGKTSDALALIRSFSWETRYLGCQEMSDACGKLSSAFWEQPAIKDGMKMFRKSLYAAHVQRLGYEKRPNDTPDDIQLRTLAISEAAAGRDESVVTELKRRFAKFVETKDQSHIPVDLVGATYKTAVREGGVKEWEDMVEIYRTPASPAHKTAAMTALGSTTDPKLITRTLAFMKTDVLDQDLIYFFGALTANLDGRRALVDDTMENWAELVKRYELNFTQLQNLVKYAFMRLSTEEDADKVEAFFKDKNTSKFTMALAQTLDTIRASAAWVKHSKADVEAWLAQNGY